MDEKDVKEGVKVRITGNTNGSRNQVGDIGTIRYIRYGLNDPENILGVNVEVPERPGGPGINGNYTLLRDCELVVEKPVLVIGNKYKVAYREGFPISTTLRANANNSVDEIKLNGQIVTLVRFMSDDLAVVSYGNEQVTGIWSGMLEPIDEEFKLPDLWYVEITKEYLDYINQYRTSRISSVTKEPIPCLLGGTNYTYLDSTGYGRYSPVENGQELTIEEFKKYVLKLDEVPTKEQVLIELPEPANIDPLKGYSLYQFKNALKSLKWLEEEDAVDIFDQVRQYLETIKKEGEEASDELVVNQKMN